VSSTLMEFDVPVRSAAGRLYHARACAAPMEGSLWEAWIEFDPVDGGETIRSARETTQPNRADAEYWATGLSAVYLEGALRRAIAGPISVVAPTVHPPAFSAPAPSAVTTPSDTAGTRSVMDPFSVYEKGEALLRKQLAALSAWHLVNIIVSYELSTVPVDRLNGMPVPALIDVIVRGVTHTHSHS
jgi:hypothetical protein